MTQLKIEMLLEGIYHLNIFNPETGETREHAFRNLITNAGLDAMVGGLPTYVGLGSGSTPPANTDTTLVSQYARGGVGRYGGNVFADPKVSRTFSYTFPQGNAAGNLSEIGLFYAASGGTMFSRSLVKDGNGAPTTITILPIEIVTVQYVLNMYWPTTDATQTITIDGVSTVVTIRPLDVNAGNGNFNWQMNFNPFGNGAQGPTFYSYPTTLGARTSITMGAASNTQYNAGGDDAYVGGSYRRRCVYTLTVSQANYAGGIGGIRWNTGLGYWQMQFNKPIMKDNTKTASFDVYLSWGRYAP